MSFCADTGMMEKLTAIYRSDPVTAAQEIEAFLDLQVQGLSEGEKLAGLADLIALYQGDPVTPEEEIFGGANLFLAMIGREANQNQLPSQLVTQRLIVSLRTVLTSLGELMEGITLSMNSDSSADRTIQDVLAASVESSDGVTELTDYLNQIKFAYASMYDGFQQASSSEMKKLLRELAPEKMSEDVQSGLNVGPFKKAQMFDVYSEKHRKLSNFVEKSVFMESLLRKFESESQRAFLKKRGENV